MTIFDYTVLGIVGFSILAGLMRGMVSEIFSLIGWVLAFYVAKTWSGQALQYLPVQIPSPALKVMVAFLLVFLAVLFLCALVAILINAVIKVIGLSGLNRLLGGLVGALRGLMWVCVLILLAGMTDLPKDVRWTNAMLSPPLEALVIQLLPWLPESISKHVHLGKSLTAVSI